MEKALVTIGVAPLRAESSSRSEMVSQATLGTLVAVLELTEKWALCQTPDCYRGWIERQNLNDAGESPYLYHPEERTRVNWALWDFVRAEPSPASPALVEVVRGVRLPIIAWTHEWAQILLPDLRRGWIPKYCLFAEDRLKDTRLQIIRDAYGCLGISYLWGGTTPKGFDCSGLAQTVFSWNGVALPRDAYQQAEVGQPITPETDFANIQPADLLFFAHPGQRISHVGISLGGKDYIHAGNIVRLSNLDQEYGSILQAIRRVT